MNLRVLELRPNVASRDRLSGEPIFFPQFVTLARDSLSNLVPDMDQFGVSGWRPSQTPPGVAGLFFATGSEAPDARLINAALRTVHMLALDQATDSVTIEVRRVAGQRDPVIDVFISR